jgi:hypothetical protein
MSSAAASSSSNLGEKRPASPSHEEHDAKIRRVEDLPFSEGEMPEALQAYSRVPAPRQFEPFHCVRFGLVNMSGHQREAVEASAKELGLQLAFKIRDSFRNVPRDTDRFIALFVPLPAVDDAHYDDGFMFTFQRNMAVLRVKHSELLEVDDISRLRLFFGSNDMDQFERLVAIVSALNKAAKGTKQDVNLHDLGITKTGFFYGMLGGDLSEFGIHEKQGLSSVLFFLSFPRLRDHLVLINMEDPFLARAHQFPRRFQCGGCERSFHTRRGQGYGPIPFSDLGYIIQCSDCDGDFHPIAWDDKYVIPIAYPNRDWDFDVPKALKEMRRHLTCKARAKKARLHRELDNLLEEELKATRQ